MRPPSLVLALLLFGPLVHAQEPASPKPGYPIHGPHLGVGLGQDVGGIIGARLSYWARPLIGCFAGGGWALVGPAWNAGIEVGVPTKGRASPFALAMYGYNAIIKVEGRDDLSKIYYGPTIGAGLMLRQRATRNYWRFGINLPFRPDEFAEDLDRLNDRTDIEVRQDVLPFTVGIGFHMCLSGAPPPSR